MAKHLCEIRFFFFFSLSLSRKRICISRSPRPTMPFLSDLPSAQKRGNEGNCAHKFINERPGEGSGFCQTIPDTMPRTGLRLIDFYNTGCRTKKFSRLSGVRLLPVQKEEG